MKTKIKSLILICALGLVGVINTNAASSYNTSCIAATLEELKSEKIENLNSSEFVFIEDVDSEFDYEKEAQLVTKWIADREEAKTIQMLSDNLMFVSNDEAASLVGEEESENLNLGEFVFNADAEFDYQKEAQMLTKWVADREEAKVVQNLINDGKLAENR